MAGTTIQRTGPEHRAVHGAAIEDVYDVVQPYALVEGRLHEVLHRVIARVGRRCAACEAWMSRARRHAPLDRTNNLVNLVFGHAVLDVLGYHRIEWGPPKEIPSRGCRTHEGT